MSTDHDVLRDPLLTVLFEDGLERQRATLPQVLAWLAGERVISFAALQPHQRHPWHAFLVQLGAIALERAKQSKLPTKAEAWTKLLLELTDGAHEPWCLVVEALDKPALLQPPVPEGDLAVLKNRVMTADALDILLTARNFDVKGERVAAGSAEHWLLALVTKQTFEGFSGAGNYGVMRMNGGFGNRPCVTLAPSLRWNDRFRRDVGVWLEQRDALVDNYGYKVEGPALLWMLPWDGKQSLSPRSLHPFVIEVCRRIRLQPDGVGMLARVGTSTKARIDQTNAAGDTGDIWTPTQASQKQEGLAALTVASAGFSYRKLHEILFEDWERPPALSLHSHDGPAPTVLAMALVRGQGKTEGYHERVIPIPATARKFFARAEGDERLCLRSKAQLERASEAARTGLKPALCTLLQGTGELNFRDGRAQPWLDRLDARVDDRFFTELFDAAPLDDDTARLRWDAILVALLRQTFAEALGEMPMPNIHRYRTCAAAEARFRAALRKIFPETTAPQPTAKDQTHA